MVYDSAADLIFKTPRFHQVTTERLTQDLGGYYTCIEKQARQARRRATEVDLARKEVSGEP